MHIAVLCKCHKIPGIIFSSLLPGEVDSCDILVWIGGLFTGDTWKLIAHSITLSYKILAYKGKTAPTKIHSLFGVLCLLSKDNKAKRFSRSADPVRVSTTTIVSF